MQRHIPKGSRPWSQTLRSENCYNPDDPPLRAKEETPEEAAQRELCLTCPLPAEFCHGTCTDGVKERAWAQRERKKEFAEDAKKGLSLHALAARYRITYQTAYKWWKELFPGTELPKKGTF